MSSLRSQLHRMNPYDIHKTLINEYVLRRPGDTRHLIRDNSRDKRDIDVIKDNHRFLWNEDDRPETWEEEFARKYYDKLFKEYCIGDLSRYKENKIALRWRIENEVLIGKGQFVCGNKTCQVTEDLKSWEVNFAYIEKGEKKNALVKIRLCPDCSKKLNYYAKKKEIKRLKKRSKIKSKSVSPKEIRSTSDDLNSGTTIMEVAEDADKSKGDQCLWENLKPIEIKTREEEMEDYLADLLV